jgi:NifU-like protein involved in Fe-S cluster formation
LGRDTEQAQSSLRFSLGRDTTQAHIDAAVAAVTRAYMTHWVRSPQRPPPVEDWQSEGVQSPWQLLVGEAGSQRLGAWIRFTLRMEGRTVRDARVQVYGCPHTIAACNHVRQQLPGRTLDALQPGTPEEWRQAVKAPVEKLGRMLIIEDALTIASRA